MPSLRGWLVIVACTVACAALFFRGLHPFLAVTSRASADILVVEGWLPEEAIHQCWNEFKQGNYRLLITTGGPYRGVINFDPGDSYADIGRKKLKHFAGRDVALAVPATAFKRDRTYGSAHALHEWAQTNGMSIKAVNVMTLGVHARRTRLMFEKALGPAVAVGIIAVENPEYDECRWWRYSEGLKQVVSEASAYLYARFLFDPSP